MNWNQLKVNWAPTVSGLVVAAAGYVAMFPGDLQHWPMIVHVAQFIALGGIASLGISSKSASATGAGNSARIEK